jgi:branched-chain amino acid transport system substrate-binding protein
MMLVRTLGLSLAFLIAGSALVRAADTAPFELNAILPLTGPAAFVGDSQKHGLQALEALVNSQGGINGRPVKFVFNDDATSPQVVVQLTNQVMAKKVAVIFGPATAQECAAQIPLVQEHGPITWCYSPLGALPKPGGYAFTIGPRFSDQLAFDMRYFRSRGFRTVGIITSSDSTGQDADKSIDAMMAGSDFRDMKIVAPEHFNPADVSVTAQIARIKAAKPDVLLAYTTGTPFATVLRGINDLGLQVPVLTSGGNLNKVLMKQYASILPKELLFNGARGVIPDPSSTGKTRQAQQNYFDALKKAGVDPTNALLAVWDPAMIVVDGLRKLGTDATALQLHDYVEKLKGWDGVLGTFDFTSGAQRGVSVDAVAVFRWDAASNDWEQVAPVPRRR